MSGFLRSLSKPLRQTLKTSQSPNCTPDIDLIPHTLTQPAMSQPGHAGMCLHTWHKWPAVPGPFGMGRREHWGMAALAQLTWQQLPELLGHPEKLSELLRWTEPSTAPAHHQTCPVSAKFQLIHSHRICWMGGDTQRLSSKCWSGTGPSSRVTPCVQEHCLNSVTDTINPHSASLQALTHLENWTTSPAAAVNSTKAMLKVGFKQAGTWPNKNMPRSLTEPSALHFSKMFVLET